MFEKAVLILLPIFLIIALGYVFERAALFGERAASVLARFVTEVALPMLLFGALASESFDKIFNHPFVISFSLATLVCFLLPWVLLPGRNVTLQRRAMRAMGATYSGVSFIGLPLLQPLIGKVTLPAVAVANVIVLFVMAVAILMIELSRSEGHGSARALGTALLHTFKTPLVFATVGGVAYSFAGLPLPHFIYQTTHLIGIATPAVALLALGGALVHTRLSHFTEVGVLSAVKLLAMPMVTIAVLLWFFPDIDHKWAVAAVVLAAMPTAVIEYLLADEYHEYTEEASGLVLGTTLLSGLTVPFFVVLSMHLWPLE